MRKYILVLLILLSLMKLSGQSVKTLVEGKVSYITSQNIYAKFEQSGMVKPGDTIFIRKDEKLIPLFLAESVSSTSCVGKPIAPIEIKVSDLVIVKSSIPIKSELTKLSENEKAIIPELQDTTKITGAIPISNTALYKPAIGQKIRGRISESSYSSFSNSSALNQRFRYSISLAADHIAGSKFSTDTYVMFTYRLNYWSEVKKDIFNALKIYSFSVKYDLNPQTHFLVGRNINLHLASVGAIDGFQVETSVKNLTFGAVAGTNPDYQNYSFNPNLFEYGGYISHTLTNSTGRLVNSFAFLQQTSHGKTDRRFAYFQQENSLIKNLNLFASCELDLYTIRNGIPTNTVSLTSLFLSLQYRFSRRLSVFASYDERKNIIYYETYKTFLDQLLADVSRQGYQLRINYLPIRFVNFSATGGYRYQKNDPYPMLNANGFLTFPQVPFINASVSFSTNWMNTSYVNGIIYGIRIYRDIIPTKLSTGIFYRLADNQYTNANSNMVQHMAEFELSWQISRKASLSASYDGIFDQSNKYHNVYISLIKRF